ncbi:MAG: ABC transporter ATP-binding protein [Alphaproteobacteria bacterium]|nr:ABC transporter ATP-binding protein [Alphaproteobacteria bacterium]
MPAPLLQVEGLRILAVGHEADGRPPLLDDFSFDVAPGEFVAIVGESGSGKTITARAILNLLPPGVKRAAGSIRLDGRDLMTLSPDQMRKVRGGDVGMVFQEPMVSLNPALTIRCQLAEGLKLHRKLSSVEIHRRCLQMLTRVQIADPERCLASYPHEFSGGMRQRIMLASVLLPKPKLLIADEPTTALDTLSQREVLELIVELARDDGVAVLLITHDLGLVAQYARRVVVLEKGRLVESGETQQILCHPAHAYTQRLVNSLPHRPDVRAAINANAPVVLSVARASVDYPGRPGLLRAGPPKRVVKNVDLQVREGEIVALVGASGSGKTTLGRAVLGLKPLSGGAIRFDGVDLGAMSPRQSIDFRRAAQLVFQDPFSSLDPRTRIGDTVGATLRHVSGLGRAERRARVEAVLDEVGLAGFAERFPHQMSGGQRQRVAIARAIISRPRLVVADEPVSALDMTIQLQVLTLFQKLQSQYGFACLFITHDLAVVAQVADWVVVMSEGTVVESGMTDAILDDPQHEYTKALLSATPSFSALALTA